MIKKIMPVITLGTISKTRKQIFASIVYPFAYAFQVIAADIDEKSIRHEDPELLTLTLAWAKAQAIQPKLFEPGILITGDQVVVWDNQIREKPVDEMEARYFLRGYNSKPVETVSAVMVMNTKTGRLVEGVDRAKVFFKPMPDTFMEAMILSGDIYHRAGGFELDYVEAGGYLDRIEGERESVLGLPKELTRGLLRVVAPEFLW